MEMTTKSLGSTCRLCNSVLSNNAISLPLSPIADKYTLEPNQYVAKYPLDLYQCPNCGHVQITEVLPLEILFDSSYTYKPSNNAALVSHFNHYANWLTQALGHSPQRSLDIGSNDGLFLSILKERYLTDVLGIDPAMNACKYANSIGVNTKNSFFTIEESDKIKSEHGLFDHISANNVFAHNDDLNSFAKGISRLLETNGIFSFEISYLIDIVEKALIGTVFHEHLSHHSLLPLIPFLQKHDLHLFDAYHVDTQGGALVCFASKTNPRPFTSRLKSLLDHELKSNATNSSYFDQFRSNIIALKTEFNKLLNNNVDKDSRIIGFGASRSANCLIEFFQLSGVLDFILDDNPEKVGKYLPNSDLQIQQASEFSYQGGDIILPLAWIHSKAIIKRILEYKTSTPIKIITFYPSVELIENSA